jgi:hypothetical protein
MDVHLANLKVVAECTVEEAKAAVSVWGSPLHRRIPCMGTVWADDQCLHQYNLADGRQITMHPWQIIVRPEGTGDTMSLQVFATDTIGSVKVQIRRSEGIPTGSQWITFRGELLMDSRTVAECNIQNGSTIGLLLLAGTVD